jgi:hypothetical protein
MRIANIKIMLYLNTKDTKPSSEIIIGDPTMETTLMLTSNLLIPSSGKRLPFFSEFADYSSVPFESMEYTDIVRTFFDIQQFKKTFEYMETNSPQFGHSNVLRMLSVLFPTTLPHVTAIQESIAHLGLPQPQSMARFSPVKFIQNSGLFGNRYSYLHVDGKPHTILKTIWINDTINHPFLLDLWKAIKDYVLELEKENVKLNNLIQAMLIKYKEFVDVVKNNASVANLMATASVPQAKTLLNRNQEIQQRDEETLKTILAPIWGITNTNFNVTTPQEVNDIINPILGIQTYIHINVVKHFLLDASLMQYFSDLQNKVERIQKLMRAKSNFWDNANVDIEIARSLDTNVTQIMNAIPAFKKLTDMLKDFINKKMWNAPELTQLVYNYAYNQDSTHEMMKWICHLFSGYSGSDLKNNTTCSGLSKPNNNLFQIDGVIAKEKNTSVYQIEVLLDIWNEVINDSNLSKFSCFFKSENLGNQLQKMVWNKNSYNIFENRLPSSQSQYDEWNSKENNNSLSV